MRKIIKLHFEGQQIYVGIDVHKNSLVMIRQELSTLSDKGKTDASILIKNYHNR